jgi:2-phospho-L-lactate guanylyltransferase
MVSFLIPFKGLRGAKTRWALQDEQRDRALLEILEHNLRTVSAVVGAESTFLVSPDPWCFERFPEVASLLCGTGSLNGDLELARRTLPADRLADGPLAVLLPDLPQLSPDDIEAMLESGRQAEVVLCPDHRDIGTNGLLLNPPQALEFLFEGESFARHLERACALGRQVRVLRRPGLANDADEVADLRRLSRL